MITYCIYQQSLVSKSLISESLVSDPKLTKTKGRNKANKKLLRNSRYMSYLDVNKSDKGKGKKNIKSLSKDNCQVCGLAGKKQMI
jgi:hypothetical protein